ncbi:hypothetical protein DM02DRAFT_197138 [Periconia macrospinosa]|uniref:Uncharacterized protein n=1 Tax=Periconia macrospinosa TaxID=97972 RepID=A0A2V1DAS3_9PLEO|nr:hypothetical protein DM02DRAFT_197138 [Periconia macrospinosa]
MKYMPNSHSPLSVSDPVARHLTAGPFDAPAKPPPANPFLLADVSPLSGALGSIRKPTACILLAQALLSSPSLQSQAVLRYRLFCRPPGLTQRCA